MRAIVVAAAVSGMAGTAVGAVNLSFQTVLDSYPNGDPTLAFTEYSVGTGGQVAAVVQGFLGETLLYRPADAASLGDIEIVTTSGLNMLSGLSLTGDGQVTWYDGISNRLLRYQDGQGYLLHENTLGSAGTHFYSVNAAGQVAYALSGTSTNANVPAVVRYAIQSGSVVEMTLVDGYEPVFDISVPQITSAGDVRFMHDGTGNREVHGNNSFPGGDPWVGQLAYSNGGTNTVTPHIMNGANDDLILFSALAAGSEDHDGIYLRAGSYASPTYHELFRSDKDPDLTEIFSRGMVTPGGRVAVSVFDDSASATSIIYWENGSQYELTEAQLQGLGIVEVTASPMVSDGSDYVIFYGNVVSGTGVFAWKPGADPFAIALGGGLLNIDGVDEVIVDVQIADPTSPYHDSFSDDGYLGLAVMLEDPNSPFGVSSRIVLVQVPEPALGGLALLGMLPLLRRRRLG